MTAESDYLIDTITVKVTNTNVVSTSKGTIETNIEELRLG
jgi:hypothetical protein